MADIPVQVKITADTDGAIAGIKKVDAAVGAFDKKVKPATKGVNGLAAAFDRYGISARSSAMNLRMLPQQFSQIAQQASVTGNVMQAVAVQAFDIGAAFGGVGVAIGALAGFAIPALTAAFSGATEEGKEFREMLEGIGDARTSLEKQLFAIQRSVASQELVTAQFEKQKLIQERQLLILKAAEETGRARAKINDQIEAMNEKILTVGMEELRVRKLLRDIQEEQVRNAIILRGVYEPMTQKQREMADLSQSAADWFADIASNTERLRDDLGDAAYEALRLSGADMTSPISEAAKVAAQLAVSLGIAYDKAAALQSLGADPGSGKVYGGRGSAVPTSEDIAFARSGGVFFPSDTRGGVGGGGRGSGGRIDALIQELQTEQEILDKWRADGLEKLASANEAELEALGGHNEAKLRLEQEYQERLAKLRQTEQDMTLGSYETLFGNLAKTFSTGSNSLLKISKAFSVAQGLINSYRAFTEVLADPSLIGRPFLRTALAASTLSAGLAQVANIKSVSTSGGGGGAGSGAAATPAAPATQNVILDLRNATPDTGRQIGSLVDQINEAGRAGYVLNIQTVAP